MNATNPYDSPSTKSPSTKSPSSAWRSVDFFVAGLWFAIPVGVFVGRQLLLPVFSDFGVELPAATQYLFALSAPILLTIVSLAVLLTMFSIPNGNQRRLIVWLACITGVLVGMFCLLSFLLPLVLLLQNLN